MSMSMCRCQSRRIDAEVRGEIKVLGSSPRAGDMRVAERRHAEAEETAAATKLENPQRAPADALVHCREHLARQVVQHRCRTVCGGVTQSQTSVWRGW